MFIAHSGEVACNTGAMEAGPAGRTPRGTPTSVDQLAVTVSAASDHGRALVVAVCLEALWRKRSLRSALVRLAVVGFSSLLVSVTIKRLVGRTRPPGSAEKRRGVRTPSSSSFPSGHTLAAATAGVALPSTVFGASGGLLAASVVGWSRVRLDAHHQSDVFGALLLGAALGVGLRPLIHWLERE